MGDTIRNRVPTPDGLARAVAYGVPLPELT
jgi:hypothetical protein